MKFNKKLLCAFAALITVSASGAPKNISLGSYVGPALYSYQSGSKNLTRLPGAAIQHDVVYVAPLEKKMDRYILNRTADPQFPTVATFTLYRDSDGNFYSYFWDTGSLTTDEGFTHATLNSDNWVKLAVKGRTLSGVFYPRDPSETRFELTLEDSAMVLRKKEKMLLRGLIPIGTNSTHTFEKEK